MPTLTANATANLTAAGNKMGSGTITWSVPSFPSGVTSWDSVVISGTWSWNGKGNISSVTINGTSTMGDIAFSISLDTKGSPLSVTCSGNKQANGNSFTWTDLIVTYTYTKPLIYYNVSVGTVEHGTVTLSRNGNVAEGTNITITAVPDDGYIIGKYYVNGVEIAGTSFVLNANSVVTVEFIQTFNVSVNPIPHGTVTLSMSGNVPIGTEISITSVADEGYEAGTCYINSQATDIMSFTVQEDTVVSVIFITHYDVAVEESCLQDIGNAIRMKNGTSTQYKPRDMAGAIDNLPTMQVPPIGFVPATWDAEGYVTSGTWYGDIIPDSYFNYDFGSLREVNLVSDTFSSIGSYCFSGCKSLTSANCLNYITEIPFSAFSDCTSLALTALPNGITSIGAGAFSDCTSLALTALPNGITSIGAGAFSDCTSLALTALPNSVIDLGSDGTTRGTFQNCTGLTSMSLPEGLTTIPSQIFGGCTNLKEISLPNGLLSIGDGAFSNCKSLSMLVIPDSVTTIGNIICCYSGGPHIIISSNIKTIGFEIFRYAPYGVVKKIEIKGKPDTIDSTAFAYAYDAIINVSWAEGEVAGAPWGATNATINYNYVFE